MIIHSLTWKTSISIIHSMSPIYKSVFLLNEIHLVIFLKFLQLTWSGAIWLIRNYTWMPWILIKFDMFYYWTIRHEAAPGLLCIVHVLHNAFLLLKEVLVRDGGVARTHTQLHIRIILYFNFWKHLWLTNNLLLFIYISRLPLPCFVFCIHAVEANWQMLWQINLGGTKLWSIVRVSSWVHLFVNRERLGQMTTWFQPLWGMIILWDRNGEFLLSI